MEVEGNIQIAKETKKYHVVILYWWKNCVIFYLESKLCQTMIQAHLRNERT